MRFEIRHFGRIAFFLAAVLSASLTVAQNANTGEIRGTVQDSTGAFVEGVKVTITNVETGVNIVSSTNSAGLYDVPSVPTGLYTITFSKTGFKNFVRKGVTLEIQTIAVDGTLQVGSISEQVVVTEETPLVETETSDQRVDLNTAAIRAAPIVGTDWRAEMIQLIPGVNTGGGAGEANGQAVGVNGTQSYNVMFLSDGGPATAPRDFNGSNYYMPVDAIGEVSVNSANAPPQYGGGLTSVNVITKSGTNHWHGSGYEYIQNTALNSRGYFNPSPDVKSVEHWNTYGGSIGGPIIRNKLFFFFLLPTKPVVVSNIRTLQLPHGGHAGWRLLWSQRCHWISLRPHYGFTAVAYRPCGLEASGLLSRDHRGRVDHRMPRPGECILNRCANLPERWDQRLYFQRKQSRIPTPGIPGRLITISLPNKDSHSVSTISPRPHLMSRPILSFPTTLRRTKLEKPTT